MALPSSYHPLFFHEKKKKKEKEFWNGKRINAYKNLKNNVYFSKKERAQKR